MKLQVFTDGGARGNPGPAGAGYVVFSDGEIIQEGKRFLGTQTNNQAEYLALLDSLKWLQVYLKEYKVSHIDFFLDSELVVNQIKGKYKVKNEGLKPLYQKVIGILKEIETEKIFTAIPREKNKLADKLVNMAIDENL